MTELAIPTRLPAPQETKQAGRRLAFGTMLMGASNIIKVVVQLVTLPLVARLLGPAEYGLYGLAMPAVFLMLMIADSGLGASLAREPLGNTKVWSSAFWFLLGSGVVLMIGLSGASFILADVTGQPRLPPIMMSLSLCLVLLTLAVPGNAILTRQGRLGVNSVGEALGNVLGAGCAIVLAWRGAGTWSLVAQTLVTYGIRTGFIRVAAPFVPKLHFALRDLKSHLAVGGSILGTRLADTGGRTVETALIARLMGAKFLGAYSFANQAPRFICESVSNALWALLYAHAIRAEDDASALKLYGVVLRVFGLLVFPVVFLIAAQAHQLVESLLGRHWLSAVIILQILLITFALNAAGGLGSALLYAKGRSDIQMRIMIESVCLRVAFVALLPWIGVTGMAVGFGIANVYVMLRNIFAVSHFFAVKAMSHLQDIGAPLLASAVAGACCWGLAPHMPAHLIWAIAEMAGGFGLYVVLLLVFDFRKVADDVKSFRALLRREDAVPA
jgi:O-antigen/teichoic acid export membrane protein